MVEIILSHNKTEYKIAFPSTWDELTTPEMEAIATALTNDHMHPGENKVQLFVALVKLRAHEQKIKLPGSWAALLDAEEVATSGIDQLQFIFDTNERTINPYPQLQVPGIRGARSHFHGPAPDFTDITCEELEDAEHFISQFSNEPTKATLASLVAIFWRLPVHADPLLTRQEQFPYRPKTSEHYRPNFEQLPLRVLMACYIFIIGCRNNLPKQFPGPYGKPKKGEGAHDPAAFTKCIHAGAGAANGTRENIRKMLAKEFLFDLQQQFEKARAEEQEHKRQLKKTK